MPEAPIRRGKGARPWVRAYLSLGSNVGRRPEHLRRALRALRGEPGVRVGRISRLYSTAPVGYSAQRDFLNGVVELRTRLGARELLVRLQGIELKLGRKPGIRNGPRPIDIDLLLLGRGVVRRRGIEVPHPRMHRRRFVLEPLAEIAPHAVHPLLRRTARTLLAGLEPGGRVRPWGAWEPAGGAGG